MLIFKSVFNLRKPCLFLMAFLLIVVSGCASTSCDPDKVKANIPKWITLSEPLLIEDVENKEMLEVETENGLETIPFGHLNFRWLELKSLYEKGDCIFYFEMRKEDEIDVLRREGYMLIKDLRPDVIMTTEVY